MFLFKRKGIYYLEYFDEIENRKKRITTKSRLKTEALKFLSDFKKQLNELNRIKYVSIKEAKPIQKPLYHHLLSFPQFFEVLPDPYLVERYP
jgi:hypothetical protein